MLRIGPAAGRGVSEVPAKISLRGKRRSGAAVAVLAVTGALGGDAGGAQQDLLAAHIALLTKQRTTCSMRDHRFAIRRRHGKRHN